MATFGFSVGDFIAGLTLIRDVVHCLFLASLKQTIVLSDLHEHEWLGPARVCPPTYLT